MKKQTETALVMHISEGKDKERAKFTIKHKGTCLGSTEKGVAFPCINNSHTF